MTMETMTCPHCHSTLAMTLVRAPDRASHRLVEDDRTAAVRRMLGGLAGRFTFAQLREMYDARRAETGWPELSDKALGRALKAAGAVSWRTSQERGWEV